MILIISKNFEPTTNFVIDWLMFQEKYFVRINPDDQLKLIDFTIKNDEVDWTLEHNGREIQFKEIESVWYRRGEIVLDTLSLNLLLNRDLKKTLFEEIFIIEEFIKKSLFSKNLYGDFVGTVNKLDVLVNAKSVGLFIPDTFIATNKFQLDKVINAYDSVISKPIYELSPFIDSSNKWSVSSPTSRVEKKDIPENHFFYSLLQNEIEKLFEIRSFFINGIFFSAAIFSQKNEKTEVDFRNYDNEKPNRLIPFNLPKAIEKKLTRLMKKINLNSGSFDLIYSTKGEYIFLEVNPVGQFGMVSGPCNYNLEKYVAQIL